MADKNVMKLAADTVRLLAADGVQKAKSGHPGMPMGCADYAFTLWSKHMRHNPRNPQWLGRDRFVLSAGHGSMLIYSMLHLFDYGVSMDDLKSFRQWGSKTPGHPEFGHTVGVEVTTGPLGSGFASGVGMAMAAKNMVARCGLADGGLFADQKIYILSSDGCMMEGTTHEAGSLAGHLKLDNIICFYDDNSISIEGNTSIAFSEDVGKRFEAYGWRVLHVANANDIGQVDAALATAKKSDGRPTLIVGKTKIGFGAATLQGSHESHGAPLGNDELTATRVNLGFPVDAFHVPAEVSAFCAARVKELDAEAAVWDKQFNAFLDGHQEQAKLLSAMLHKSKPEDLEEQLLAAAPVDKPTATRASGGVILQTASKLVPALIGGSADLAPSTKTLVKGVGDFSAKDYSGRNLHFGVREMGMALIGNGMALYGTAIPYVSTFMVFSDYMKPAMRLAALQKLPVIYVLTHDSIFVGEDGPTHQPIEHLAMMRAIPGMTVIRPAEAVEAAQAWYVALTKGTPVVLLLTRQDLAPIPAEVRKNVAVSKGAYVLCDEPGADLILIATGSEVELAINSAKLLRAEGRKVRVVSMPSRELFLAQPKSYQDSVLPPALKNRVSIELGITTGWRDFVGDKGLMLGIDHFGASAPYQVLAEEYGFTPAKVVAQVKKHFA